MEKQSCYFPLRWESTGEQWWYASPIDWAAANGHYDLVRELLHLDANLLIKLTSLRRLRRLETVWDDDLRFADAARCRSSVARSLLLECEAAGARRGRRSGGGNALLRAGYGGWLLYTAASAGDAGFVRELLERDPLLVFGEGEYGVTDIFYAAARGRSAEVFRLLFDHAVARRRRGEGEEEEEEAERSADIFRAEMVNRAVHAAARGGDLEMLTELLVGQGAADVLVYRDVKGSTILHAASGRGQVEVVSNLVASYDIIDSKDNQGNTALHIAAYRGHLPVVEALITASPSLSTERNNAGDTFLHMAVAGFRTPGFRRLDHQMDLMKQLVSGTSINIQELINTRNNDGRTVLHVAVIGNMHSDLVELLMTVKSINLNIRDNEGMTPLDLLSQRPRSASSEILIKQLVSAGGITNFRDRTMKLAIANQLKLQGIGSSPGTSFKISDSEIFLYTGVETAEASGRHSSCSSTKSEIAQFGESSSEKKKNNSVNRAARRLKILLGWSGRKEKEAETTPKKLEEDESMDSVKKWSVREDTPTPLRQRFSKSTALVNNKRTLAVRSSVPSPTTKKKFAAGLMHGVMQDMPHLAPPAWSPPDSLPMSGMSTPPMEKLKGICPEEDIGGASCSYSSVDGGEVAEKLSKKSGSANTRLMNQYFCFGSQGLAVENSVSGKYSSRIFKRSALSVA